MSKNKKRSIMWFRQDLRLGDNPALHAAAKNGDVLPVYILDNEAAGLWSMGGASRVWLHHSLTKLNASLDKKLSIHSGRSLDILNDLIERHDIEAVYWNRCYEPWSIDRDKEIKKRLGDRTIQAHSFSGSLLWEPWEVLKADGTPYRVFTPFYRKGCLNAMAPRTPRPKPKTLKLIANEDSLRIADLALTPSKKRWDEPLIKSWQVGENAARRRLNHFIEDGLTGYKTGRNFPSRKNISRLSPHLHWGEISPNMAWHAVRATGESDDVDTFCAELGWREFSHSLLYHFPELPTKNFQTKFDAFPWTNESANLEAWRRGMSGVPIIDAGMRELWQTGYMHNRVRMIVASFLVKNLMIDWREGEKWFWDTLFDADLANNSASWQWVAGSGADAAPYFRVFNPVTQAEKFDPDGNYIRQFVPELAELPTKHLFAPWIASSEILHAANVVLGESYPQPVVDLKLSREATLAAFQTLKKSA
ncbi:MAG: deoxyribodipyrimidine photo-lyase [Pseudomonadota bacterium]